MSDNLIDSLLNVLPLLKNIIQEDMEVVLADTTKILAYFPGDNINNHLIVGRALTPNQPLYRAIHENKTLSSIVPKELHGITFKSVVYPIKDSDGKVIAVVGTGKSLEKQIKNEEAANELFHSLKQTNLGVQDLAEDSQRLALNINAIIASSKVAEEKIKKTDEIIKLIQAISRQTNLLGLNAAIESSRAGEYGRGFSIVAIEIRKLAKLASKSSTEIFKELEEMKSAINQIVMDIEAVGKICDNQSACTEEITANLEEMASKFQFVVESIKPLLTFN